MEGASTHLIDHTRRIDTIQDVEQVVYRYDGTSYSQGTQSILDCGPELRNGILWVVPPIKTNTKRWPVPATTRYQVQGIEKLVLVPTGSCMWRFFGVYRQVHDFVSGIFRVHRIWSKWSTKVSIGSTCTNVCIHRTFHLTPLIVCVGLVEGRAERPTNRWRSIIIQDPNIKLF
jgi:hypothetical protein